MSRLDNKSGTSDRHSPKRDFQALESRRRSAARMFASGAVQADVARSLGVTRQSVSRWYRSWRIGGEEALKAAEHAGRNPRISDQDVKRLDSALRGGAIASGFGSDAWTLARVAAAVNAMTGVSYHPGHMWRILTNRVGWSVTHMDAPSAGGPRKRQKTWLPKS